MDNLLCEESWPSSPITPEPLPNFHRNVHHQNMVVMSPMIDDKTVEEALACDLKKESLFGIHGDKFLDFIVSKKLIDSRFRAIQWIVQTRSRLNLSYETVFSAANVFDRFLYMTSCDEWTNWMVELVVLTSLSIASKFNEVTTPMLQELQMEGLNHLFHHKTALEMEIIMLKALEWRVNSVTSYSFSQILVSKIGMGDNDMMMNRITQHLVDDLCDLRMLQYAPSVVAFAAMWNVLEETGARDENLCKTLDLFGQKHKEQIAKCIEVMKSPRVLSGKTCEVETFMSMIKNGGGNVWNIEGVYGGGDLSAMFQILWSESDKKRERDHEYEDQMRPAKRMTMVMSI